MLPLLKSTHNCSPIINPSTTLHPLISYPNTNPIPLQHPISPTIHTTNPFGTSSHFNESIPLTLTNNNTNTSNVSSQHSLLSPINPTTPTDNSSINQMYTNNNKSHTPIQYQYNSPLYNNNINTNNSTCDNDGLSVGNNENIIHSIVLNIIHNPNDPLAPKYKWNVNIKAINGILSNKYIKHLNDTTNVINSNTEHCEFELEVKDKRLKWLLPFDIPISKEDSIEINNIKSNGNSNGNSIINRDDAGESSDSSNSSESSLFIPETINKNKYTNNSKHNQIISSIINRKKPKKFKYSDKSKESGYCGKCNKHFNGYRGLVSHRAKVHDFYGTKKPLTERYLQEQNELNTDSESDSNDSDLASNDLYDVNSDLIKEKRIRKRKFEFDNINTYTNTNKKRKLMNEIIDNSCGEMEEFSDEAPMQPITPVASDGVQNNGNVSNDWAERKKLFELCVANGVKHLLGNTKWSNSDHGPNGLHKTPNHWCRYCGSRLSKRWYANNRLCSKHMYIIKEKKEKIFKNCTGKDLISNHPYAPNENKELEYLREFVGELNRNELNDSSDSESDINNNNNIRRGEDDTFEVYKLHCKKILYGISNKLIYYLVEWSGYDINDASWVPLNNLTCDKILKEFENRTKSDGMKYCIECELGSYKCKTKPCFKHHFNDKAYAEIFHEDNYAKTEIRRLARIQLARSEIKRFCNQNNLKLD